MARLLPSRESTGKQGFAQSAYHALNLLSWVSSRGDFSVERDLPGRAAARTGRRASIEIDWATRQQHNIMIFD